MMIMTIFISVIFVFTVRILLLQIHLCRRYGVFLEMLKFTKFSETSDFRHTTYFHHTFQICGQIHGVPLGKNYVWSLPILRDNLYIYK